MHHNIKALLTNIELILINQDEECRPVYEVRTNNWNNVHAWFRHLSNNEYALGVFNFEDGECCVPVSIYNMGLDPKSGLALALTDTMTGEQLEPEKDYFNFRLSAHAGKVFRGRFVRA